MKSEEPTIIVKRARGRHPGHHGGAWKVAYADFVTAMMAFFLVMWIVGQKVTVRQAIAAYFRNPQAFSGGQGVLPAGGHGLDPELAEKGGPPDPGAPGATAGIEELERAAGRIREALSALPGFEDLRDQIEITVTAGGVRIELIEAPDRDFFDTGSAVLKEGAARIMGALGAEIGKLGNLVIVEGHTDSRRYSNSDAYTNWELSTDRANAARRQMERHGLRPVQVKAVNGYADTRLRVPSDPYDAHNRRVSVLVTPSRAEAAAALAVSASGTGSERQATGTSER